MLTQKEVDRLARRIPEITLYLQVMEIIGIKVRQGGPLSKSYHFAFPLDYPFFFNKEGRGNTVKDLFEKHFHNLLFDNTLVCEWAFQKALRMYSTATRAFQVLIDIDSETYAWTLSIDATEEGFKYLIEKDTSLAHALYSGIVALGSHYGYPSQGSLFRPDQQDA